MQKNEVTAQHLAAHPEEAKRYRFALQSPFSGKMCYIASATKTGKKVTLTTEDGLPLFVEATRKLQKEKRKKK